MTAAALPPFTLNPKREKQRRTFQPVRRNSYHVGTREHTMWKPIGDGTKRGARRFIGAYMRVAEKYDYDGKQPGKANGPLGHVGLQLLRVLMRTVDYRKGTLEPSIDTLMGWCKRSRAAIVAALARLKAHGFIDWIRRTIPIEDPEPFGPQVKQATNAYGIDVGRLPREIAALLRRLLGKGPLSADVKTRDEVLAEMEEMVGQMPLGEQASARGSPDPDLDKQLDSLGAALEAQLLRNASSPDGLNPETGV